jgi:hypothetical protein
LHGDWAERDLIAIDVDVLLHGSADVYGAHGGCEDFARGIDDQIFIGMNGQILIGMRM